MNKITRLFTNKWLWILLGIIGSVFIIKSFLNKPPVKEIPPRPVETAIAIQQDSYSYIDSFGNLYPPNDVNIKAQVTGAIKEVKFNEGKEVKTGDLLFIIDPSTYQADLDKARAALMQDLADLKLKKVTFDRNKILLEKQLISQQDFDTYEAELASAEAKVRMDNAEIELAKINLDYCYVRSPVNGLTSKRLVDLGNIVTANDGPTLVNIKTIDTLYIDFTIPETNLAAVRNAMKQGKLKVEINADDGKTPTHSGELELLDNSVDNTTGTVLLRAIVSNKDRSLWAGQFVIVRLILGIIKNAVIIPYEAVQIGQAGPYLFVVTAENKTDLRLVKTGQRQGESIVIFEGVKAGEKVVTSGHLGLSPGVSVVDVAHLQALE